MLTIEAARAAVSRARAAVVGAAVRRADAYVVTDGRRGTLATRTLIASREIELERALEALEDAEWAEIQAERAHTATLRGESAA